MHWLHNASSEKQKVHFHKSTHVLAGVGLHAFHLNIRPLPQQPERNLRQERHKENTHSQSLPPPRRLCFSAVCLSVWLEARLRKNYQPNFHETWWKGASRAKEETIKFWCGYKSRCGSTTDFSLSLTLQETVFGLGEGQCCLSALPVVQVIKNVY